MSYKEENRDLFFQQKRRFFLRRNPNRIKIYHFFRKKKDPLNMGPFEAPCLHPPAPNAFKAVENLTGSKHQILPDRL